MLSATVGQQNKGDVIFMEETKSFCSPRNNVGGPKENPINTVSLLLVGA